MLAKRLLSIIVAIATGYVSFLAYEYILEALHAPDATFWAYILIISILVHEIGHWVFLEANGIKSYMFFLVLIGGAGPYPNYSDRLKTLSHSNLAGIYLAGIFGNLLIIVGSWILARQNMLTDLEMARIINLNAGLVFLNLLPIGILDGGRFTKMLFDTTPEWLDGTYAFIIFFVVAASAVLLTIFSREAFVYSPLIVFFFSKKYSLEDDPHGSHGPHAMSHGVRGAWLTAYLLLIVVGMVLMSFTPQWLEVPQ